MKKSLLSLAFLSLISFPVFAVDIVCEPESDTAVSYGIYSVPQNVEVTFVKYATNNNQDDYWIRISERSQKDKLLYDMTLIIDGQPYRLLAIPPDDKHAEASLSMIEQSTSAVAFTIPATVRTPFRYYPLAPELVDKLENAKSASIIYNKVKRINIKIDLTPDFLAKIQNGFKLTYVDYPKYWKPNQ